MRHTIQLSAVSPGVDYSVKYIEFNKDSEECTTLSRLVDMWRSIEQGMNSKDVSEIVLVFQRTHTQNGKRFSTSRGSTFYVRQFSGLSSECRKFTSIVKLMKIAIVNLTINKSTSRRDIYYQDISLFKNSQLVSNSLIDMMCGSLGIAADDDLLVHASQKGMVFGEADININSTIRLSPRYSDDPQLIPILNKNDKYNLSVTSKQPAAIIVIEKEAVFKFFCNYIKKVFYEHKLLVLTGKGFPDKATKKFLSALNLALPYVPILGFMDADVYGLSICRNYRMGNMKGENVDISNVTLAGAFLLDYSKGWTDTSVKDLKMMTNFVSDIGRRLRIKDERQNYPELQKWHRELTRGMFLFKKSELNVVDNDSNSTSQYILEKVDKRLRSSSQSSNHLNPS